MEWTPIIDCAYDCEIVPGDATTTCDVAIQLLDFAGNNLKVAAVVHVYFSTDSDGLSADTVGDIADTSTGETLEIKDNELATLLSTVNGAIVVELGSSTNDDYYCCVILPNGKIVVSEAITITGN